MRFARYFLVAVFSFVTLTQGAVARDLTLNEKLSDLDQMISLIKAGYGPLHYKAEQLHVDIDALRKVYAARIAATRSNAEFYYVLSQFVPEFQDSHFSIAVPTLRQATLSFTTDLVAGKVLVDSVQTNIPVGVLRGDEIVSVDGRPIAEVLDELQKYANAGTRLTARRKAAMLVSSRPGKTLPVPSGAVMFGIKDGGNGELREYMDVWVQNMPPFLDEGMQVRRLGTQSMRPLTNFDLLSTQDMWADLESGRTEQSYRCSGSTRIGIPTDATIIMQKPFVAYYHPTKWGNIGYLRIPHYAPQNEKTGQYEYDLRFSQYEYAISVLEKNTVGLVIDQDHNCGGSVDWLHRMVGLFMDKPFSPMQFQLLATKEQYLSFARSLQASDPHTIEYQGGLKVLGLIKGAWERGDFMTGMTAIDGQERIFPNAIRYTKPVVVTIDEMSGSGGDAFPALMQGYGRAKLLGTRTMGAGGHVVELPPLYYSQMSVKLTKSLFYRPDGVAVENNGAVPDYPYTITKDDFKTGYLDYHAFAISKLAEQLRR